MIPKYLFPFALIFLTIVNLHAQEAEPKSENGLKAGSWSLQFSITNNFRLSSFEGTLISAKKHFSDKKALRFGLTLSGNTLNSNEEIEDFRADTLANKNDNTDESDNFSFGFNTHFLYYPAPTNTVNIYWGVGPSFSIALSTKESSRTASENQSQTSEKRTSISVGVSSALGVEWFVSKNFSFIAEYGLQASYLYFKGEKSSESSSVRTDITNRKEFRVNRDSVKFGLSVYF